jgi:hypothetical protein
MFSCQKQNLTRELLFLPLEDKIHMVHAYNACDVLCLLYVNPLEKSPSPV